MKSLQAQVGAGPLIAGPIEDIFVKDDAVYAVVNRIHDPGQVAFIIRKQFLNRNGAIAAWGPLGEPKAIIMMK